MVSKVSRSKVREEKHRRMRRHIIGTPERPRMAVFRSNNHMYVQIIDDVAESRAEAERLDTLFNTMKNLMDSMKWTSKQALEAMRVSDKDQAIILKRL
mgnify:CR=1 FL=1